MSTQSAGIKQGSVMSVKLAVTGFVMAGLVSAGAVTVLVVTQPQPERQVQFVAPASVVSTPTVAPVAVPTTEAPAPVESAPAPAPVVAPTSEVVVPKVVEPKPIVQTDGNDPAFIGRYANGDPVKKDANGTVVPLPPDRGPAGNAPNIDGHGVPIPTATPTQ